MFGPSLRAAINNETLFRCCRDVPWRVSTFGRAIENNPYVNAPMHIRYIAANIMMIFNMIWIVSRLIAAPDKFQFPDEKQPDDSRNGEVIQP